MTVPERVGPAPIVDPEPACLACGAVDLEPWAVASDVEYCTTPEPFAWLRCARCDALSINPVPADRLSAIYPPNYYSFGSGTGSLVQRVKDRLDARALRGLLRGVPGATLAALDVGGGSGWQLDLVRRADARVGRTVVVDIDGGAERLAREKGHEYFCGRIEQFHDERRFDLVLLLNLIEHVRDPLGVLEKVRTLLSARGVALVQTPNHRSLDARLFRHASWTGFHTPRHWVLFTRESFARVADRAGLTVRAFRYTQGASFWAGSVLALLSRRGLVSVTRDRPVVRHPLFAPLAGGFAILDFARRPFAPTSQMVFVLGRRDGEE